MPVIKILFLGNSLTYTNDLPGILRKIALADSTSVQATSLCFPNYSLEDHWNDGLIEQYLADSGYHFVVAQQGPSVMPESRALLIAYAKKICELCKKYDAKFCLFTVWPSKMRLSDLDAVINSYQQAAKETESLLAPAGLAWKLVWQQTPTETLYGPEDFHPSATGSFVAALTIYGTLKPHNRFSFVASSLFSKYNLSEAQWQRFQPAYKKH